MRCTCTQLAPGDCVAAWEMPFVCQGRRLGSAEFCNTKRQRMPVLLGVSCPQPARDNKPHIRRSDRQCCCCGERSDTQSMGNTTNTPFEVKKRIIVSGHVMVCCPPTRTYLCSMLLSSLPLLFHPPGPTINTRAVRPLECGPCSLPAGATTLCRAWQPLLPSASLSPPQESTTHVASNRRDSRDKETYSRLHECMFQHVPIRVI